MLPHHSLHQHSSIPLPSTSQCQQCCPLQSLHHPHPSYLHSLHLRSIHCPYPTEVTHFYTPIRALLHQCLTHSTLNPLPPAYHDRHHCQIGGVGHGNYRQGLKRRLQDSQHPPASRSPGLTTWNGLILFTNSHRQQSPHLKKS